MVKPSKSGYLHLIKDDTSAVFAQLHQNNNQDLYLAKGSLLKISINKAKTDLVENALVRLIYTSDEIQPAPSGQVEIVDTLKYKPTSENATFMKLFYFKHTSKVKVEWQRTVNGAPEIKNQTVSLVEYDTAHHVIKY
ncbi:hypothetical protein [Pontibacter ruber]|uniref:Uncharacterized protein n=2 Tax=Pontibacter ruber TaxID=1343895 RepID=A0ABW5CQT4_9BACT